jgi:hypothetical protein
VSAISIDDVPLLTLFRPPQPYNSTTDHSFFSDTTSLGSPLLRQWSPHQTLRTRSQQASHTFSKPHSAAFNTTAVSKTHTIPLPRPDPPISTTGSGRYVPYVIETNIAPKVPLVSTLFPIRSNTNLQRETTTLHDPVKNCGPLCYGAVVVGRRKTFAAFNAVFDFFGGRGGHGSRRVLRGGGMFGFF